MGQTTLQPNYLDVDYYTLLAKMKEQLATSDIFQDYNYEGSNISILLELVAYLGELQTFFVNKIAKNVYIQTADQYENVHRIATQSGYEPKGFRSARTILSIDLSHAEVNEGDILEIPSWHQLYCSGVQYDGNPIYYATTTKTICAADCNLSINVPVRQGVILDTQTYSGDDLLDDELLLPKQYNYAYDDNLSDQIPTIQVIVDGEEWTRTPDFYDDLSGIQDIDTVYMFVYDKYERSKLVFNKIRSVPDASDVITVRLLQSLGSNGIVGINEIDTAESNFIYNVTQPTAGPNNDGWIWLDGETNYITITHDTSIGGKDPDTIDEIKEEVPNYRNAQFRNVTKSDYQSDLNYRSDIITSTAWGEQEIDLTGNTNQYNKVHISVIPSDWSSGTIPLVTDSSLTLQPCGYNPTWELELVRYLELRRTLNSYEQFELPHLIYLTFDIEIKIKRSYDFNTIKTDIKNKLIWYFDKRNRNFGETISFTEIHEYLLELSNVKPAEGNISQDEFSSIIGIRNLIIRDIDITNADVSIYEPNDINNYPMYETNTSIFTEYYNKLNNIVLGQDMFPILKSDLCTFAEEL